MGLDPFGRAIRDHHRGEREAPLLARDGDDVEEHPIETFYFEPFTGESDREAWVIDHLSGPLLDAGAGAGRHALYFQEQFETVAIEIDAALVETMRERGVADARRGDMFALRESFERDRFRSVLAWGTQLGLAGSMAGLRALLTDLAAVTASDATAVVDCHDPEDERIEDLLGYREDPTVGLAHRVFHFEYEGEVGPTLQFRLFSPDRLREATAGTAWSVVDVDRYADGPHYAAALA